MKCIRVLRFSNIGFCIWAPGGIDMSRNWKDYGNMHNELQTCGKSWSLSGYNISVILISVYGHQGAATCLKIGNVIPAHNLHAQWIANLWQIIKSIGLQHFSRIDFCIWPPGGSDMSINWGKKHIIFPVHNLHTQWIAILWQIMKCIRVLHFSNSDSCIWPGGIEMSKN